MSTIVSATAGFYELRFQRLRRVRTVQDLRSQISTVPIIAWQIDGDRCDAITVAKRSPDQLSVVLAPNGGILDGGQTFPNLDAWGTSIIRRWASERAA